MTGPMYRLSAVFVASYLYWGEVAAQDVSYSLGPSSDLLDNRFYSGESNDGMGVASRFVLNVAVNNAGTKAIFWGVQVCPCAPGIDQYDQILYIVDIGDPSSWQRLGASRSYGSTSFDAIHWVPDDSAVLLDQYRYDIATGIYDAAPYLHGYEYWTNSVTRMSDNNWLIGETPTGGSSTELVMLPIFADGTEDSSREPVIITNLGLSSSFGEPLIFPSISPDGTAVLFNVWDPSPNPDLWDIYLLENVDDIIAAPKIPSTDISSSAPTLLTDPNIVDFRASETNNPALLPRFSQDGTLVFYSEDFDNTFATGGNLYEDIANGNWDISIANRDGTGDVRFLLSLNQGNVTPFPTGSRFTFVQGPIGSVEANLYAGTLTSNTDVSASATDLPEGGTTAVIDGNLVTLPFTLTDSAVQIDTPLTVGDASGTTVQLPTDQVINFPEGTADPVITIDTPIDPVGYQILPDVSTQIAVIRTFGPAGTEFEPPITITISYSEAEVASIQDESQMIPYLYNTSTELFEPLDAEFLGTVIIDMDANTLTFQTDHFSTYGIGFSVVIAPGRPWAVYALAAVLAVLAAILLWRRRESMIPF